MSTFETIEALLQRQFGFSVNQLDATYMYKFE